MAVKAEAIRHAEVRASAASAAAVATAVVALAVVVLVAGAEDRAAVVADNRSSGHELRLE